MARRNRISSAVRATLLSRNPAVRIAVTGGMIALQAWGVMVFTGMIVAAGGRPDATLAYWQAALIVVAVTAVMTVLFRLIDRAEERRWRRRAVDRG